MGGEGAAAVAAPGPAGEEEEKDVEESKEVVAISPRPAPEDQEQARQEQQAREAEEEEEEEEEEDGKLFPAEAPPGVAPMMISMKNMEKYELKTGPAVKDTLAFKWFDKAEVLEEIAAVGFYSDFNDFRKEIQAFPGDRLLVVADHEEQYGQNWAICLTEEAGETMFGIVEARRLRREEAARAAAEAEAARLAAEEAERNVVYEDKPLVPRPRASYTVPETESEIEWLDVRPARRLMSMSISRKRSEFGAPMKFSDRDAEQSGLFEFRQHKDPNFELRRTQVDVGLQACPSWTALWIPHSPWKNPQETQDEQDAGAEGAHIAFQISAASAGPGAKKSSAFGVFDFCSEDVEVAKQALQLRELPRMAESSSQTNFFRPLNAATQYEYLELTDEQKEVEEEERRVGKFLAAVLPVVEFALQQNETLDVFADEFSTLRSEEVTGLGNKEDNVLRELRTFTDLVYSNGKVLSSVDWHPRLPNVVAVACSEPLRFDQRVEHAGKERNSFILVWNFADLIHPQLVLQSPHECTQFSFNPDQPHLIAGGCVSGQVVLWDISKAMAQLRKRKEGNKAADPQARMAGQQQQPGAEEDGPGKAADGDVKAPVAATAAAVSSSAATASSESVGTSTLPPIEPLVVSLIDQSHKRPVSHLEWIPNSLHVNSMGRVKGSIKAGAVEKMSHQFVTCAGDGRIMFWDSRFNSFKRANNNNNSNSSSNNNNNNGSGSGGNPEVTAAAAATDELHWTPTFKCALSKNEGTGEFGLSKVSLRGRLDVLVNANQSQSQNINNNSNNQQQAPEVVSGTAFSCTTEEGDMIFGDWQGAHGKSSPREGATAGTGAAGEDAVTASKTADDKIEWVATDHFRNCLSLRRSPFFPYLLLSVAPNGFNIWQEDLRRPLFTSPLVAGLSQLTCADWSPTRPGVVIVGRSDGSVDVWDLTDQSHRPSATVPVSAYAITSIQFRRENNLLANRRQVRQSRGSSATSAVTANTAASAAVSNLDKNARALRDFLVTQATARAPQGDQAQLVALGDATGNLHVLDIPRNLRWRMPKEEHLMQAFFERELERVAYVKKRARVREEQRNGLANLEQRALANPTSSSFDEVEQDMDSKEYRKLVEAEEKRFQALSAKLLGEDLAPSPPA